MKKIKRPTPERLEFLRSKLDGSHIGKNQLAEVFAEVDHLQAHAKDLSDSLAEASGVNEIAYGAGEQAVSKRKDQEIKVYADALQRLADGKVKKPTGCLCCNWNGDASEMKPGDLCPCCNSALGVNVADYAAAVLNAGYDASL